MDEPQKTTDAGGGTPARPKSLRWGDDSIVWPNAIGAELDYAG